MKGITKLGLLAVAGVAVNEIAKSGTTRSANTTVKAVDAEAVKNALLADPGAMNYLKGNKGDAGFGYNATSTSSVAIATGSKTFATQGNLAYSAGARVRIASTADTTKFMEGVVTSYADYNLIVNVDLIGGTGTFADWKINIAGERGIQGAQGIQGIQGVQGLQGNVGNIVGYLGTINFPDANPVTITHNLGLTANFDRLNVQIIGADSGNAGTYQQNAPFKVIAGSATANTVQLAVASNFVNYKVIILAGVPDAYAPFSGSMIRNSSLDMDNNFGFTAFTIDNNMVNGLKSLLKTTMGHTYNTEFIKINPRRLYKFNMFYKAELAGSLQLRAFDYVRTEVSKTTGTSEIYPYALTLSPTTVFTERTMYAGGVGAADMNFPEGVLYMKMTVYSAFANSNILINSLVVTMVNLGEPVPYNLPWLPAGQVVFDPTTGKLGRYNGTAIVWSV